MTKALTLTAAAALLLAAAPLAAQDHYHNDPLVAPGLFAPLPGAAPLRAWAPQPAVPVQRAPSLYRPLRPLYQPVLPVVPTPTPGVAAALDPWKADPWVRDALPRHDSLDVILERGRQQQAERDARRREYLRDQEARRRFEAEEYHRAVQRNRQMHEDGYRNVLRGCAQYNRGCFNELGGRLPRQR